MITLTITVPTPQQVIAANYVALQLLKSATGQQYGSYANVTGASVALDPTGATTSYQLTDINGGVGDWYEVVYTQAGGSNPSAPGAPMPGYLSDLCTTVRDLLGVTTNEVADSQLQGYVYLPMALATCRERLASSGVFVGGDPTSGPVFDVVVGAGGDASAYALAALAHLLAARVCERMKVQVPDTEQLDKYRIQRNRIMDWSQTATELLAVYEEMISRAAGYLIENTQLVATLLAKSTSLAGPTRAGYDTTGGLITVNDGSTDIGGDPVLPNDQPLPGQGFLGELGGNYP